MIGQRENIGLPPTAFFRLFNLEIKNSLITFFSLSPQTNSLAKLTHFLHIFIYNAKDRCKVSSLGIESTGIVSGFLKSTICCYFLGELENLPPFPKTVGTKSDSLLKSVIPLDSFWNQWPLGKLPSHKTWGWTVPRATNSQIMCSLIKKSMRGKTS